MTKLFEPLYKKSEIKACASLNSLNLFLKNEMHIKSNLPSIIERRLLFIKLIARFLNIFISWNNLVLIQTAVENILEQILVFVGSINVKRVLRPGHPVLKLGLH